MSWRRFFQRARWDEERRRELAAHVELEIDEGRARGLTPDDARAAAYRKLGNPTLVREEIYTMNSIGWLDLFWQDLKYGARVLRKTPSFTAVALASLALGIGTTTAIFALVNAISLRALPLPHADALVEYKVDAHGKGRTGSFRGQRPAMTYPMFEALRDSHAPLGQLFAWGTGGFELADSGESRPARGLFVSGGLFARAGVRPALGRLIGEGDDTPGCGTPAVVLNYAFWQKQFGGDPRVIDRTFKLDGVPFVIAGVSEPSFFGFDVGRSFDVALPFCADPLVRASTWLDKRDFWWISVMARLDQPGDAARAGRQAAALSPAVMEATMPANYRPTERASYQAFTVVATPVGTGVSQLRADYDEPLRLLLAIAGIVLVIACANLANLMLARATVRRQEMAVRLAIGASRRRLVRQLMVESLLLAVGGAVGGAVIARSLSRLLLGYLETPSGPPVFVSVQFDWRVFGFTLLLASAACVLFGLVPAIRATRTNPAEVMRGSGRGVTDGRDRFGLRRLLVLGQLALSLVLVTGALLFGGTLWNLLHVDLGFTPAGVRLADLDFRQAGVPAEGRHAYMQDIVERLRAIPGMAAVDAVALVPLGGSSWNELLIIDGKEQKTFPFATRVGGQYFSVMHEPILAGRTFTDRDTLSAPPVAVVSEQFGRQYFGTPSPIGRTFQFGVPPGQPSPVYTIVGVVPDLKYQDISSPVSPVVFLPVSQDPEPGSDLSVVYRGTPAVDAALTRAALAIHPRMLVSVEKVDDDIAATLLRERLMATLAIGFGAIASLLAAVGLYGVTAYVVTRRRVEIGIRLALGAERRQVIGLFLRESLWLIAVGLGVGVGLAYAAARTAASLLFGVTATSPAPFAIAAAGLALIALAAAFVPTYRASRVAPTRALRE